MAEAMTGRCTCGAVRYEMVETPLFTHCCHCSWCQRETGTAFVLNALIETEYLKVLSGDPVVVDTPSESGKGQRIRRCPDCQVALWSTYGGSEAVSFVRVGTLETPAACPPDIHIFTTTKLPWIALEDGKPVMEAFYRRSEHWPKASLERLEALKARLG